MKTIIKNKKTFLKRVVVLKIAMAIIPTSYAYQFNGLDNSYKTDDISTNIEQLNKKDIISELQNDNPIINGLQQVEIFLGDEFDPHFGITAFDVNGLDITHRIKIQGTVNLFLAGHYQLQYIVIDDNENQTKAIRTIIVQDVANSKPKLNGLSLKRIFMGKEFDPRYKVSAKDAEDGDLTAQIEITGTVDTQKAGIYTLKYSVTDSLGAKLQRTRMIIVEDLGTKSISFKGLTPVVLDINQAFDPLKGISAHDKIDGDISENILVIGAIDNLIGGVQTLKYKVTNSQGATKVRQRSIRVKNTPPVLTGIDTKKITLNDIFLPIDGVFASDKEDGDISDRIQIQGEVNTAQVGTYYLKYQVTDNNGASVSKNRKITVSQQAGIINEKPKLHGVTTKSIAVGSFFDPMSNISAFDIEDGDISDQIHVTGHVDTKQGGAHQLQYWVVDSQGESDKQQRTIWVKNDKPTILGASTISLPAGQTFDPLKNVTATDKEDGDISHKITVSGNVNTNRGGLYLLNYSVTDSNGASAFAIRSVKIANSKPTFNKVETLTIKHNAKFSPLADVQAFDAEDGNISDKIIVTSKVDTSKAGIYFVTYKVSDSNGARAMLKRAVMVHNTHPRILNAQNITISMGTKFDPFNQIQAIDNEDGDISHALTISGQVDINKPGTYRLNYFITDSGKLSAKTYRTVRVTNDAPIFHGIENKTLIAGQPFNLLDKITASDLEDGDITKNIKITGQFNNLKAGRYRIYYSVQDKGGKKTSKTRIIIVKNELPKIKGLNKVTLSFAGTFDPLHNVSAFDKEDGDVTQNIQITGNVNTQKAGLYTLKYKVTDSTGASVTKRRSVHVKPRYLS